MVSWSRAHSHFPLNWGCGEVKDAVPVALPEVTFPHPGALVEATFLCLL